MEVREPAIAYCKERMSIEAYLEMENTADEKHQYYKGEIIARPASKVSHDIITGNFLGAIGNKLKGKNCHPYGSDARVYIPSNTLFTYPGYLITTLPVN